MKQKSFYVKAKRVRCGMYTVEVKRYAFCVKAANLNKARIKAEKLLGYVQMNGLTYTVRENKWLPGQVKLWDRSSYRHSRRYAHSAVMRTADAPSEPGMLWLAGEGLAIAGGALALAVLLGVCLLPLL